jgi:probable rRNA maturation factor
VLTFAYERAPQLAADIVICVPVVRREAREQGKTVRQHLAHLVIHGVLHAQGFDHERDAKRASCRTVSAVCSRSCDPYLRRRKNDE